MSTAELSGIITDLVLSLAAGITAYVACKGIGAWQRELGGRATFEVARMLMKATYLLRDEVGYCRSPFISSGEFPTEYNEKAIDERTSEDEGKAYTHVYSQRWETVGRALREFDIALLEAEALWGEDIKTKGKELRQCVRHLQVDIDCFVRNKYSGGEEFQDRDYAKAVRSGVSSSNSTDNELTTRIERAVTAIEDEIRPRLSIG